MLRHCTYGTTELGPHGPGEHEVHPTALHRPVGGEGADGEHGEAQEGVGEEEDGGGLHEAGVAHNVANPQEEDGGEHGEGDRGQDALHSSQTIRPLCDRRGYERCLTCGAYLSDMPPRPPAVGC